MNETEITRETAVARIRQQLIALPQNTGMSMCRIAAEKSILCRGFHHDSDDELRWRYADKIEGAIGMCRQELEARANEWQLERQKAEGTLLCCDVQYRFNETCRGWDDFSNEELSKFCLELTGEAVHVIGRKELAVL
jgi:hypothetical protein